ncbi:MAG: TrpR-like protein, YerC/YecD [Ruminococcaceae bacterium]|nr:TrpR-like protein, YerC/YecD [Oscillospiraceae bacterium]
MDKKRDLSEEYFFAAAAALETKAEAKNFFKFLCTEKETQLIAQRLYVAKLLSENRVYSDIVEQTGASSATVSRVKRAMETDREYFKKLLGKLNEQL